MAYSQLSPLSRAISPTQTEARRATPGGAYKIETRRRARRIYVSFLLREDFTIDDLGRLFRQPAPALLGILS